MKHANSLLIFPLVLLFACQTLYQSKSVSFKDYRVGQKAKMDSGLLLLIKPYGDSLHASMDQIIGLSHQAMYTAQPESGLGNFMADAIREMAEKKYQKKVDAGFMNKGGIRSFIPKGNITVGKIYELMPFDNLIVIQKMTGEVLQIFLDKTAADGGWPVSSGVQLSIKQNKAVNVLINGAPLDPHAIYTIANSDYVANGGSDCSMLKNIPQENKAYLMRDAFIDFIQLQTQQGKAINYTIQKRVVHAQ